MLPECSVWFAFVLLLLWTTGAPGEETCSVLSDKEVRMGSNIEVHCVFKKPCSRLLFQNEVESDHTKVNSTVLKKYIRNLTQVTTITCRCKNEPEPCGADITPGYPPEVPHNLTCVREGESGKVRCTWKTGRRTLVKNSSYLWVRWDQPTVTHTERKKGSSSAEFSVSGKPIQLLVWVNVSNSLGSKISAVHNFTLDDIVRPLKPNIKQIKCSSRRCQIYTDFADNIQIVEIKYRLDMGEWITVQNADSQWNCSITSLHPYSLYTFKVRWRFSPTRGLWSEWVEQKQWTDEEAPKAQLDAWYVEESTSPGRKSVTLFWKELSKSDARGRIQRYELIVIKHGKIRNTTRINPSITSHNVSCFPCDVQISAYNSKGASPARVLHLQPIELCDASINHKLLNNSSVALSWSAPVSTSTVSEVLVEWYPAGQERKVQWRRVQRHKQIITITDLHTAECYAGAVVYLNSSQTKKIVFGGVATWQTAPKKGPSVEYDTILQGDSVVVKWSEIPPEERGGCLTKYNIYMTDTSNNRRNFSVPYPQREFTIRDLTPGETYSLQVSASTAAGEGPKGMEREIKPPLSDKKQVVFVITVGSVVFFTCLFFLCVCQFPSVQKRVSKYCHCLKLRMIPDPANSKWAKECANAKGEIKLLLHLSDPIMADKEPDTVEVQEVSRETSTPNATLPPEETIYSEKLLPQQLHDTSTLSNIISSYLKSMSNESSSSDATQASRSTDITVDYLSTHVMSDEDDDEAADEDQMFGFFPCPHSPFLEALGPIGGTLTLESVKIDCSEFLDCA